MIKKEKNFLSKEECKSLIKLIKEKNQKSTVSNNDSDAPVYASEYRNSSTSHLDPSNPLVYKIHQRIADYLGVDIKKGEHLQGQLYEPGEYFKEHYDWFSEGESYDQNCLHSGQRTHTFMVYLNEPKKGGKTKFPKLDKKFKAKRGMALTWPNMKDGKVLEEVMHEGAEVKKGKKYIITAWFRENTFDGRKDSQLYIDKKEGKTTKKRKPTAKKSTAKKPTTKKSTGITQFTHRDELPRLTKTGFTVVKAPEHVFNLIQETYQLLKPTLQEEVFEGKEHIIKKAVDRDKSSSDLLDLSHTPTIRTILHDALKPIHEDFIKHKEEIEPSAVYGIRSYNKGAILKNHVDRIPTHHVSSIIIVDKDIKCDTCKKGKKKGKKKQDWPLQIQAHDGTWHDVYAKPGEMILYESAICEHGREKPFKGKYFRNFYVHYKLKNWEYVGNEQ